MVDAVCSGAAWTFAGEAAGEGCKLSWSRDLCMTDAHAGVGFAPVWDKKDTVSLAPLHHQLSGALVKICFGSGSAREPFTTPNVFAPMAVLLRAPDFRRGTHRGLMPRSRTEY